MYGYRGEQKAMKKAKALVVAVIGGLAVLGAARAQDPQPVTATGWFACDKCATTRAKQGKATPAPSTSIP
jgi:hypothetical protein